MRKNLLFAAACCLLIMVAGCSMPLTRDTAATTLLSWQERQNYLQQLRAWSVNGRIAMRTPKDAWSASLKWQQQGGNYDIELFGPLGGKALSVSGGSDYVVLTTDEGDTFSQQNASMLIYEQTGWQVPVESLNYWARAMPVPGEVAQLEHDEQGRLSRIQQAGWDIRFQDYQVVNQLVMPRKLRLESRHFTVKLVFRNWQLDKRG